MKTENCDYPMGKKIKQAEKHVEKKEIASG